MYNFYGNSTIHNPCQKVESKHFAFLLNVTRWSTVSVGERPWITWTVSWLNEYSMGSQKLAEFLKTFILQGGLTFTIMLYFWFWWRYLWTVPCVVLWQPESVGAHKRTWKEKLLNCSPPIYFYTSCILSIAAAARLSWSGLGCLGALRAKWIRVSSGLRRAARSRHYSHRTTGDKLVPQRRI